MKSLCLKSVLISTFALILICSINTTVVYAQKSAGGNKKSSQEQMKQHKDTNNVYSMLKLKPEQKKAIFEARMKLLKEITPLKNQLKEKAAHLKTLSTTDKPDINAINTTIDEIGSLRTQIMKLRMTNKMVVRSLLNDDQKVIFDARGCKLGMQNIKHRKKRNLANDQDKFRQKDDGNNY